MSCDEVQSDRNSLDMEAVPYSETVIKFYHTAEESSFWSGYIRIFIFYNSIYRPIFVLYFSGKLIETAQSSNRHVQFEDYLLKNKAYNSLRKLNILQIVSE